MLPPRRSSEAAAGQRRSDRFRAARTLQHFHRRITLLPVMRAPFQVTPPIRRMRGKDQTRADRPALDAMAHDQFEHEVGPRRDGIDDLLAALVPVVTQDRWCPELQIWHHLAERAPRGAPADLLRLQYCDIDTGLGQVQCRRKPGEACTDDGGRDVPLLLSSCVGGGGGAPRT